jgi:hypothetical protein
MSKTDLRPAALAAGIVVIGGIVLFSRKKKKACLELPDIWSEEGPMHMTQSSQDQTIELARYKIREHVLAVEKYTLSDIVMAVADGLRECKWENLETDQQKQVWSGIENIVKREIQAYNQDPDAWMASF